MYGQLRKTLPRRLDIVNLEHEIQRMEADLNSYREKVRIFEETLREQQYILSRLQKRDNPSLEDDSDC